LVLVRLNAESVHFLVEVSGDSSHGERRIGRELEASGLNRGQ
jgi:hypothetical protein